MRLKVDENLGIGDTKETVSWEETFDFDCIVNEQFTYIAARITPINSTPNVFVSWTCGMRSCEAIGIFD